MHYLSQFTCKNEYAVDASLVRSFFFRYDVIAEYINQHTTSGITRNAKDIIAKTKNLQKLGEYTFMLVILFFGWMGSYTPVLIECVSTGLSLFKR